VYRLLSSELFCRISNRTLSWPSTMDRGPGPNLSIPPRGRRTTIEYSIRLTCHTAQSTSQSGLRYNQSLNYPSHLFICNLKSVPFCSTPYNCSTPLTKYINTYRVPQCLSSRRNWDPPSPPLPQASVSPPPEPKGGGGGHTRIRARESQFGRLEKSLALCLPCDSSVLQQYCTVKLYKL
jgi:hypothetical protein